MPFDSMTCTQLSAMPGRILSMIQPTCTPMINSPMSSARGFEKIETASPPATPVPIGQSWYSHFGNLISRTQYATQTDLSDGSRIQLPILEYGRPSLMLVL